MTNPPSPYGVPSPYGAPSPYGSYLPPKPPKKSSTGLVVALILAVLLLAVGGVGGYYWWHEHVGGQSADHPQSVRPSPRALAPASPGAPTPGAPKTDSLAGHDPAGLLRALPQQSDFPSGWTVQPNPDGKPYVSKYDPPLCEGPFQPTDFTPLGSVDGHSAAPGATNEISVELAKWNTWPKLSEVDDYVQQCAAYTRTDTYKDGSAVGVSQLSETKIDAPKAIGGSTVAFQEMGTTAATYSNGKKPQISPFPPDNYYVTDIRGLVVWFYCANAATNKDKCDGLFVKTINNLATL